jgi:hypothetical protein
LYRYAGMLRATPHRVALTSHERLSLVRFNGLDPGAVVAPLPRFLGGGGRGGDGGGGGGGGGGGTS